MAVRDPAFWWTPPDRAGLAPLLLSPVAAIYGAVAAARMRRSGVRAGAPVICVGNFTLGGAGKTPLAIWLARMLAETGATPALLSRGYGGSLTGPVRVDPAQHTSLDVGDEPLLLARAATTIIARDRAAGAKAAIGAGASVVIMDDGLQNPSLAKDLTIAVVDGARGVGNGCVFPAGPLRAPLAAQMPQVDALMVIGDVGGARGVIDVASARGARVFHGRLEPAHAALDPLRARKALAFAGIGNPEKFFATLAEAGIAAPVRRAFPDHHRYSATDAAALIAQTDRDDLELVTTEKDFARMAGDPQLADLAARVKTLPVTLAVRDAAEFRGFVLEKVRT
jgi:tetraacyldisaccharide 4'-kinase